MELNRVYHCDFCEHNEDPINIICTSCQKYCNGNQKQNTYKLPTIICGICKYYMWNKNNYCVKCNKVVDIVEYIN